MIMFFLKIKTINKISGNYLSVYKNKSRIICMLPSFLLNKNHFHKKMKNNLLVYKKTIKQFKHSMPLVKT